MIYISFYILVYFLLQKEYRFPSPNMFIRNVIPILFTLFVGLRGANVGQDTAVYYQHYYMFGEFGCDFVEPGFDWINRFCYHQGWDSWTLLLICAALTVFFIYKMLNKLERGEYTISAMFLYCCTFTTLANGMRQAVVCGIFLYLVSFYFDKVTYSKKEIFIYIVGILLSSLMHVSVLLLIPVLLLNKVPANKKIYLIIYVLSFSFLFYDVSGFLPNISLGNRDYGRYAENVHIAKASGLGFFATTFLKLLIFYSMYKYDAFEKCRMLSHFVMFYFILANLSFSIPIINRVSMYFTWFTFILIAKLYDEQKRLGKIRPYSINVWTFIFGCYVVLQVYGIFSTSNHLTPYTTFWQNNDYQNYIWKEK